METSPKYRLADAEARGSREPRVRLAGAENGRAEEGHCLRWLQTDRSYDRVSCASFVHPLSSHSQLRPPPSPQLFLGDGAVLHRGLTEATSAFHDGQRSNSGWRDQRDAISNNTHRQ